MKRDSHHVVVFVSGLLLLKSQALFAHEFHPVTNMASFTFFFYKLKELDSTNVRFLYHQWNKASN